MLRLLMWVLQFVVVMCDVAVIVVRVGGCDAIVLCIVICVAFISFSVADVIVVFVAIGVDVAVVAADVVITMSCVVVVDVCVSLLC